MSLFSNFRKNKLETNKNASSLASSRMKKYKKEINYLNKKLFGKTKFQQRKIIEDTLIDYTRDETYYVLRNLRKNVYNIEFNSPYNGILNTFLKKIVNDLKNDELNGGKNLEKILDFTKYFKNIDKKDTQIIFNEIKENIRNLHSKDFIISASCVDDTPSGICFVGNTKIVTISKEDLLKSDSSNIIYIIGHEIGHYLLSYSSKYRSIALNFDVSQEFQKKESIIRKTDIQTDIILSKQIQIKDKILKTQDTLKFLNAFKRIDTLSDKLKMIPRASRRIQNKIAKINKNLKSNHFEELICDKIGTLVLSSFLDYKKLQKLNFFLPNSNLITTDKNNINTHPRADVRNALINVSFKKLAKGKEQANNLLRQYDQRLKIISKRIIEEKFYLFNSEKNTDMFDSFKNVFLMDLFKKFNYSKKLMCIDLLDKTLKETPCIINKKFLSDPVCYENLNHFFDCVSETLEYSSLKIKVTKENKNNILRICENGSLGILFIVDKKEYFQDRILKKALQSSELLENINLYLNYNRESFNPRFYDRVDFITFNVTPENLDLCVNLLKTSIKLNLSENYILNLFDKPGLVLETIYNECKKRKNFSLFNKIQKSYRY